MFLETLANVGVYIAMLQVSVQRLVVLSIVRKALHMISYNSSSAVNLSWDQLITMRDTPRFGCYG